jgi:signal transduction histidine kinase
LTLTKYILTLLITISYTVLTAQTNNYYVQHFNNENDLVQNSIKAIEIDKKGYLWFATEMGLVRFDGTNFKYYDKTNSPELETDRILNVGLMKDGNVFAQVEDKAFYYNEASGVLQHIPANYQDKNILNNFSVIKIYDIYNTCRSKYENGQIPQWALPDYTLISSSLYNSLVYLNGSYYYFNKNKDLITVDTSLTTFHKIILKGELSFSSVTKKDTGTALVTLITRNNTLYAHFKNHIYQLTFPNIENAVARSLLDVGNIANITSFLEVPKFNMFVVGTSSDGFYIFQKQDFSVLTLKDNDANVFYAQAPYGYDGVLTEKGVLFPNRYIPLPNNNKYTYESILKTTDGNYFLSRMHDEFESGIVELSDQLQEIRYMRGNNIHVNCFRQLKDGSIWMSLKRHRFGKIEKDHIKWLDYQSLLPNGFKAISFIESTNNEIWIGGYKGLVRINLMTEATHIIPGLMDAEVRSLYEDTKGTIWIGTYGNGYYAFYKGKCIAMPMDEAHFLATAHTFMEDNSGNIWITTNRGLFQVQTTDLYDYLNGKSQSVYYYYYDKNAGFLTNEFNGGCNPSGIKLNNGKFSLPSMKGLVQFSPDSIKPIFPDAQIYVDAIRGDTTMFNNDKGTLSFSHNIDRLQFYISSPYFGNSFNQLLEYKLNNAGNTWYKVNKNGVVQFNNLPPGKYRLQFRKTSGFGSDKYITKEVLFSVMPYFYETWMFKMLVLAILMAFVYSFFRLRILFLKNQKMQLEAEVLKKTKEQESLIIDLRTTVSVLEKTQQELYQNNKLKEELALLVAHDLQSPFRFISSATQRLYKTLMNKEYIEAQVISLELSKFSNDTYRFVEDFALWLSSLGKVLHLQNTGVNMNNLLTELSLFFTELLAMRKNKLEITVAKSLVVYTDSQLLTIILRNIIDNANKHTTAGTIHINAKVEHSSACIIISDDGEGMKEEVLKKLQFQIKYGTNNVDTTRKLHGNGYRFISEFCNLLNIHVEVESKRSEGTTVRLTNLKI